MNTLLSQEIFADLRKEVENRLIARFKNSYKAYDKRLNGKNIRCIKVTYVGDNRIYVETTYKSGQHCGHSYLVEDVIDKLVVERNLNAIFFNAIRNMDKEDILRSAKRNNEKPFGYVIDYLKDVYFLPKLIGSDIADNILEYFEIDNECFS
jgi:hypothetical protein